MIYCSPTYRKFIIQEGASNHHLCPDYDDEPYEYVDPFIPECGAGRMMGVTMERPYGSGADLWIARRAFMAETDTALNTQQGYLSPVTLDCQDNCKGIGSHILYTGESEPELRWTYGKQCPSPYCCLDQLRLYIAVTGHWADDISCTECCTDWVAAMDGNWYLDRVDNCVSDYPYIPEEDIPAGAEPCACFVRNGTGDIGNPEMVFALARNESTGQHYWAFWANICNDSYMGMLTGRDTEDCPDIPIHYPFYEAVWNEGPNSSVLIFSGKWAPISLVTATYCWAITAFF